MWYGIEGFLVIEPHNKKVSPVNPIPGGGVCGTPIPGVGVGGGGALWNPHSGGGGVGKSTYPV